MSHLYDAILTVELLSRFFFIKYLEDLEINSIS